MSVHTYEISLTDEVVSSLALDTVMLSDEACCWPSAPPTLGTAGLHTQPTIETHYPIPLSGQDAVRHKQLFSEVTSEPNVRMLTDRLYAVDAKTWGHCNRVGSLMIGTALMLGMSETEAKLAGRIGVLHDLGKADPRVQAAIHSPAQMNTQLFSTIKMHPWYGVVMAKNAGLNANVLQGIGNHHSLQTERPPYGTFNPDTIRPVLEDDGRYPDLLNIIGMLGCNDARDALEYDRKRKARAYQQHSTEQYGTAHTAKAIDSIAAHPEVKVAVLTAFLSEKLAA